MATRRHSSEESWLAAAPSGLTALQESSVLTRLFGEIAATAMGSSRCRNVFVINVPKRRQRARGRRTRRSVSRFLLRWVWPVVFSTILLLAGAALRGRLVVDDVRGLGTDTPVQESESPTPRRGKDYAVLIATDNYDQWPRLNNPVRDVEAIAGTLRERYDFNTEVVRNPTQDQLLEVIGRYAKKSYEPDDQLLLYFAGHGDYNPVLKEGCLVTRDSRRSDAGRTSYLALSRLRGLIEGLRCKHVLVTLDVCYAGAFDLGSPSVDRGGDVHRDATVAERIAHKMRLTTRRYIASTGCTPVSDGVPGQHSPFAGRFLEALREGDKRDGLLTLSGLMSYVDRGTPAPVAGELRGNEAGSDFVFVGREVVSD